MKYYSIQAFLFFFTFILLSKNSAAQLIDSTRVSADSASLPLIKPNIYQYKNNFTNFDSLLKKNKFINVNSPVSLAVKQREKNGKEFLFYLLGIIILLLAMFKVFYSKYFNNIFRVFFNTSLRQNQLTDLLLQAKLASLIFNIFFVLSAGLYVWLLLHQYHLLKQSNNYIFIGLSILFVALIYTGKFLALKIIGWISGISTVTDQYIFVIFLINKIIGVVLIPFIILLAFGPASWLPIISISSFCIIGILFLLRYLRSYGLLQNQLKIKRLHFLLYITGIEILPLLLIYKLTLQLFG